MDDDGEIGAFASSWKFFLSSAGGVSKCGGTVLMVHIIPPLTTEDTTGKYARLPAIPAGDEDDDDDGGGDVLRSSRSRTAHAWGLGW